MVSIVEGIAARRKLNGPRLVPLWLMLDTQPRLLDDPHRRAVHAPDLVLGLPARLAVLPGPGPAVPPARQLRRSSTRCGPPRATRPPASCSTSCCRCASRAPAASPGSTTSLRRRPAAVGVRHGPGHRRAGAVARRQAAAAARTTCCRSPSRHWASSRRTRRTACACRPATAPLRAVLVRAQPARPQRLPPGADRAVRLRQVSAATPTPRRCSPRASADARREVPNYDTGAWSLYSRGAPAARVRPLLPRRSCSGFLHNLCTRTDEPVYCTTERNFTQYQKEPPVISLASRDAARRQATAGCDSAVEDLARRC